jgi:plastocyanin
MHKPFMAAAVAAFALVSVAALPATASAKGPDQRRVELRDSCDVATFDAVIGPGTCAPHKGREVTFDRFVAALDPDTHVGHNAWRINPQHTTIHAGDTLNVVVRGGEFHTFTEVANLNPLRAGCVQFLNDALGRTLVDPNIDCATDVAATAVTPGGPPRLVTLSSGTHYFICLIHPWMTSTVVVKP